MEPVFSSNAVYMLASRKHGTIYIGVTSQLVQRVSEHKAKTRPGFTSRHGVLANGELHQHPPSKETTCSTTL